MSGPGHDGATPPSAQTHPNGVRFVISDISSGPADLREALPAFAVTLTRLSDPTRQGVYWCGQLDQPIKHRLAPSIDLWRYRADYLGEDDGGQFFWVYFLAIRLDDSAELTPSARGLVGYVAYVIDQSLGDDQTFDVNKVDWVATAIIDGTGTPEPSPAANGQATPRPLTPPPNDPPPMTGSAPSPRRPVAVTCEEFRHQLEEVLAALAALAGLNFGPDVPRPTEVKARRHIPGRGPTYSFDGHLFRYHTVHPIEGLYWRSTADPDEALYWIVDDVARSIAWAWAQRAPSARTMTKTEAQSRIAMPFWHNLMDALDTDWGVQTGATITALRRNPVGRRRQ